MPKDDYSDLESRVAHVRNNALSYLRERGLAHPVNPRDPKGDWRVTMEGSEYLNKEMYMAMGGRLQ